MDPDTVNCDCLATTPYKRKGSQMTKSNPEVPGNAMATAAMTQRILSMAGHTVYMTDHRFDNLYTEGIAIKAIRFKNDGHPAGTWLCVVTAETESGSIVAFHNDTGFRACLLGVLARIENNSLKWKEDQYAK